MTTNFYLADEKFMKADELNRAKARDSDAFFCERSGFGEGKLLFSIGIDEFYFNELPDDAKLVNDNNDLDIKTVGDLRAALCEPDSVPETSTERSRNRYLELRKSFDAATAEIMLEEPTADKYVQRFFGFDTYEKPKLDIDSWEAFFLNTVDGIKDMGSLIAFLNRCNEQGGMKEGEFVDKVKCALKKEPQRFGELLAAHDALLDRLRQDLPIPLRRQRSLENLACYACLADHDYKNEMIPKAMSGGPTGVDEYYNDPKTYGPAMKAVAQYLGLEGPSLTKIIFEETKTVN